MTKHTGLSFLCISSYFKGEEFIRACKQAGNTVYLLTATKLKQEAWPYDHIDEAFYLDETEEGVWDMKHLVKGLAWMMRSKKVDRVVALDDFDVEKAALVREEFRIPGMGQTTARYFRDKLAMRVRAAEAGIPVPPFTALFNDMAVHRYLDMVEGPWLIKPRGEASATGIKKVLTADEFWEVIGQLGDRRYQFLAEQFRPGDVYHVDALSEGGKLVFCKSSRYVNTPMEVAHGGGIFRSMTLPDQSKDARELKALTTKVMKAFGMQFSASHTEFIRSKDTGEFVFLETSSRVGGAHLAEMVEAATGVNLWREWARLETAQAQGISYSLPDTSGLHAGIIVSLARQEYPDMEVFDAEEICWKIRKKYHVGMILRSGDESRIQDLSEQYTRLIFDQFHASAPVPDKPTS